MRTERLQIMWSLLWLQEEHGLVFMQFLEALQTTHHSNYGMWIPPCGSTKIITEEIFQKNAMNTRRSLYFIGNLK